MSDSTKFERTVAINSTVNNFLLNRDTQEYKSVLEEMYLNYSTTNEFASLPQQERANVVNVYKEMRDFIAELTRLKAKLQPVEAPA